MKMSAFISWAGTAKGTSGSNGSAADLPSDPQRFVPCQFLWAKQLPTHVHGHDK